MNSKDVIVIVFAVCIFSFSFATVFHLGCFLSSHTNLNHAKGKDIRVEGSISQAESEHASPWSVLLVDFCLVSLFMIQHTLQAKLPVKNFLANRELGDIQRLFYNGAACVSLQIMMKYWQPVPDWAVWEISTSNNFFLWCIFSIIHITAWCIIYSGCLIMDMFELMGIKQVYYSQRGWVNPLSKKSDSLCKLYSHMRHPSFSAFCVILFVHPIMQIDRLMLAYTLVIYMILAFKVDEADFSYHKRQLRRKEISLQLSTDS